MFEKLRALENCANPDHSAGVRARWLKLQGRPHPFVSKEAVERYNRILLECYEAQLAWRTGS